MKKIILSLLTLTLLITGCNSEKKDLPKKYLGKYIQDGERNEGVAILSKKGNKYYIKMETTNYLLNKEYDETHKKNIVVSKESLSKNNLVFEGKIKKMEYKEYGTMSNGIKVRDEYYILFEEIKASSGTDLDKLNYIWIYGDRKLEKSKDYIPNDYKHNFSYQKEPVSIIQIGGHFFKKTRIQD